MQDFSGLEYLKIDIANSAGNDKMIWEDRLNWFEENKHQMGSLVVQADEPAMFYAGCKAYNDVIEGNPIGYPISLDATSSGLQILACLTGCRKSAELCNVVPVYNENGVIQRQDAYTVIYSEMLNQIGEEAKITRADTKDAIMTALYSSKAVPKRVFGEGPLLELFYETMEDQAPGAWELNEAFLNFWNPEAYSHNWVLPDNFHANIKVMDRVKETVHFMNKPYDVYRSVNQPMKEGRSLSANVTHSIDGFIVREMSARCGYNLGLVNTLYNLLSDESADWGKSTLTENDKLVSILWKHYENSGYLSARIINVLNRDNLGHVDPVVIWELLESLPDKPFSILTIHDAFRCLPQYANDLRKQYINQLALIAKSELLSFILSQILKKDVKIGKLDPDMWQDVYKSEYALS